MYEVLLTHEAQRFYEQADPVLVRKLNRCFQCLRENPHEHPNIKRLKGLLAGHFRYQIGDWRVVYRVDGQKMTTAKRFEDLEVWQGARDAVNAVYKASSNGAFVQDYALRHQIRRAAVSIPSNIAEGFSRHSNKEFIQFLFVSKGSAAEVQSQLYTALDQGYIPQGEFDKIYGQIEIIAKQVSRFITYLKGSG